jgi:hypothetical protein
MKPFTAAISIAVLALPLFAADQQQQQNTTSTTLSAPAAPQQQDSALVRAAKATGRLGKKPGMVITNETLLRSGGHFTTTTVTPQLPAAYPQPNNEQAKLEAAMRAKRAAEEKAKRDAAEQKRQDLRRASADYHGESIEERVDDPAMQEHQMEQMTSTQPKVQPASKPPQN